MTETNSVEFAPRPRGWVCAQGFFEFVPGRFQGVREKLIALRGWVGTEQVFFWIAENAENCVRLKIPIASTEIGKLRAASSRENFSDALHELLKPDFVEGGFRRFTRELSIPAEKAAQGRIVFQRGGRNELLELQRGQGEVNVPLQGFPPYPPR